MKYFQISACLLAKVKPATDQHQSISPSVIVKATQNRKSPFVPTIFGKRLETWLPTEWSFTSYA